MSTDRETTRVVRSWLEDGATALPDRVLDAVLDQLPATLQRRSGWSAWRSHRMNTYAKLAAGAAAVLVLTVVAYQLLPRNGGIGGQPTVAPSPAPALLAKGAFLVPDDNQTELDAVGDGASVSGSMTVSSPTEGSPIVVDLECARTTASGLLVIGGTVSDSADSSFVEGSRFGIMLKSGSPVRAGFLFDPPTVTCIDFVGAEIDPATESGLRPIEGTIQLRP